MMRLFLIIFLVVTFGIQSNAQKTISDETEFVQKKKFKVKSQRRLKKQLDKLPIFKNSFSGLCVYDIAKKKYIIEYNSDKYFTPASNTKLFTLYAGLKTLENNIPTLYYTEKKDSLIIWGSAAPTLLYSVFNDSTAYNFLRNSKKQIYFSNTNFLNKHFGYGWAWDDFNDYYSKELTALPIFGNAIKVTLYPNGNWDVNPKQFKDSIKVMGYGKRFRIKRELNSNKFNMWLSATNDTLHKEIPFISSSELSLVLLSDSLNKIIIPINRLMLKKDIINTIYGIKSDSIFKTLMLESDNYLAESVILMSASHYGKIDSLKTTYQIETITDSLLSDITQKPRWVDGSGLSRYNLFTPQSMVEILIKIRTETLLKNGNMNSLFEIFPTGGQTGTLKKRFTNYPPFIYAKTGTLSNNHNLSGYLVTKSGKLLIFSYMNNHYKYKTSTIKKQTDKILEDFYLYY